MSIKEQINQDLIKALKAKDEISISTLRLLKAAIQNVTIAEGRELGDDDIITIVSREVKKRQEASEQFRQANRPELAEKEGKEAEVLKQYLPEQMSDDDIKTIVTKAIAEVDAQGPQDMGKVMSIVMPQVKGRADGSRVSSLVQETLKNG